MATYEESMNQIRTALGKDAPHIGLDYYAIATHLVDINNFYLVPLSLYRLMPVLEQPGRPIEEIEEYAQVIYKSPSLDMMPVRGMIRAVDSVGSCALYALDYGVLDMDITRDNIFQPLHHDSNSIPGLAQLCELVMCFPLRRGGTFTDEAISTFKFFMGQKGEKLRVLIREMNNYKLGVEVISARSNPDTVATVLSYCNVSQTYCGLPL